MSPGSRIALAVLLVAAAGPAGFFAYRLLSANHLVPEPSAPAAPAGGLTSASASPASEASPDLGMPRRIPEQLPHLALPDQNGVVRKLADWRGRVLLVNFWATWCEPCRREIPLLKTLYQASEDHRVQVVGIAVDERDPVLKYARAMGIDYPVLIGGEQGGLRAIDAFGMDAELPFTVFADGQGQIVTVKVGELHPDEARFIIARVLDVDRGRMALAAAREAISAQLKLLATTRAKSSADNVAHPAR
ncbi:MAG TPA: TlpA disulfide reductase family protein [Steroidobacteraceae bacterium]|nr:TlpA disulfide reductase family protein [Steroidobacteraceae bacterium]